MVIGSLYSDVGWEIVVFQHMKAGGKMAKFVRKYMQKLELEFHIIDQALFELFFSFRF